MARVLVLYIVILISACAAPQLSLDEQGTFLFQDESFSISAPQGCMHNPSVRDSPNSVRFTARRGGWQAAGDYSMAIYALPEGVRDEASFRPMVRTIFNRSVEEAGNRVISGDDITVNDRPAFQGVSTDDSKAVVVSTNILFPNHLVMVQLLYPWDPKKASQPDVPWSCYQEFIRSIEHQSSKRNDIAL